MDKFYVFLRNILRKEKATGDNQLFNKTVETMMKDDTLTDLCENYIPYNEKISLKIRLQWMKKAILKKNRKSLCRLIRFSNMLG